MIKDYVAKTQNTERGKEMMAEREESLKSEREKETVCMC